MQLYNLIMGYNDAYSRGSKLKKAKNREHYFYRIAATVACGLPRDTDTVAYKILGCVNTCISSSLFPWKKKHFPVIDCDSTDAVLAATYDLGERGFRYAVIESSNDHFWIIVDFVGSLSKVIKIMEITPGIDSEYVRYCRKRKAIYVRAASTSGRIPSFLESIDPIKNAGIKKWIREFQELYESKEMKDVLRVQMLQKAVADKMVAQFLSDPSIKIQEV